MLVRTFALVVASLAASTASASIQVVDDPVFGVGALTRDTAQGLDFLDLTLSTNLSADYVRTQFDVGGEFEGFRYATQAEVINLINNYGFSPTLTDGISGDIREGNTGADQLSGLVSILGQTLDHSVYRQTWGITGTYLGDGHDRVTVLEDLIDHSSSGEDQVSYTAQRRDLSNAFKGSFLVRETVVPEPASVLVWSLLGFAATGMTLRKKSRASKSEKY